MSKQTDELLNPFVFPTETDGRFLLLIFVVFGAWFNLLRWLLVAYTNISDLSMGLTSILGAILLFLWTLHRAKKSAPRQIAEASIPLLADANHSPHLDQMTDYVRQTVFSLSDVLRATPQFLWQTGKHIASGQVIGYGRQQYVLLFGGLLPAYVLSFSAFRSILLHELAHIANRDVSKTTFSIELGKVFFRTSVVVVTLLNLWAGYHILKRLVVEASLLPVGEGGVLFLEMNLKIALLMLLVEAVRSSVLRAREYDADARAAIWLGPHRLQLVQALRGAQKASASHVPHRWHVQLRQKYLSLHPSNADRVRALLDSRTLFAPRAKVTLVSGLLVGFALNGNIAWSVTAFVELINFESILFYLLAFGVLIGSVVVLGLFPLVQVVGTQLQKAVFADLVQPGQPPFLSKLILIKQACLLSSGLTVGFLLTPIPSGLSIASVAVGFGAVVLAPWFWLGWTIVFLLWIFAFYPLWQQFYVAQLTVEQVEISRKYMAGWAMAVLLPTFAAMAWTQMIVGQWIGGGVEFSNIAFVEVVAVFVGAAWLLAIPLHVALLKGGSYLFRKRGCLAERAQPISMLPDWAKVPQYEPLPQPANATVQFSSAPPPL